MFKRLTIALFLFFCFVVPAQAAHTVSPTDDSYVSNDGSDYNRSFGNETEMHISRPTMKRAVIKFDVSGLTPGTLHTARLRLGVTTVTTEGTFVVDQAHRNWNERSVSWHYGPQDNGYFVTEGKVANEDLNGFVEIDITRQVNYWIRNPSTNYGLIIYPGYQGGADATFATKENTENPILKPVLVLDLIDASHGTKLLFAQKIRYSTRDTTAVNSPLTTVDALDINGPKLFTLDVDGNKVKPTVKLGDTPVTVLRVGDIEGSTNHQMIVGLPDGYINGTHAFLIEHPNGKSKAFLTFRADDITPLAEPFDDKADGVYISSIETGTASMLLINIQKRHNFAPDDVIWIIRGENLWTNERGPHIETVDDRPLITAQHNRLLSPEGRPDPTTRTKMLFTESYADFMVGEHTFYIKHEGGDTSFKWTNPQRPPADKKP